jgi:hypothetical protein
MTTSEVEENYISFGLESIVDCQTAKVKPPPGEKKSTLKKSQDRIVVFL